MLPALTDDTRVDLRRPFFDVPSTPVPAAVRPDLEPDDDMDDAATIQLSRLAWPEPPMSLAERPRLIRTDGGLTTLTRSALVDQHPTYWRGLAIAVILAASISVFVPRPRSHEAPVAATQPRPTATAVAPQPAPPMPPLIITVGTPPSANTVAPPPSKTPVAVTKLPVARPAAATPRPKAPAARPAVRPKPASSPVANRSASGSKSPAFSADTVVDDGF
jgi:hypothetical protein